MPGKEKNICHYKFRSFNINSHRTKRDGSPLQSFLTQFWLSTSNDSCSYDDWLTSGDTLTATGVDPMQSDKDPSNWMNNLCDDVLLRILSLLTVKEAAATSVLSKKWKYMWIASLNRLVFDEDLFSHMDIIAFEKMVDSVVHHFPKSMTLKEFCVHFDLHQSSETHINEWLDFAFRVGTTRVELNLVGNIRPAYSVPIELFHELNHGNHFSGLRELVLISADMSDQVFEAIITTCASLECLVVAWNDQLLTAKCNVPHMKLKRLTIDCRFLDTLEIIAPNLASFSFWHSSFKRPFISIEDARRLVNLNILTTRRKDYVFGQFSAYISQLQCLTLDTKAVWERIMAYGEVPSFNNLTFLSLVHHYGIPYERAAICMLEASPLLQRFELHLPQYHKIEGQHDMVPMSRHNKLKKILLSGIECQGDILFLSFLVNQTSVIEIVEVTTSFVDYNQLNRDGSFRQSFSENENIQMRKYFEQMCSSLLSTMPSKISARLF